MCIGLFLGHLRSRDRTEAKERHHTMVGFTDKEAITCMQRTYSLLFHPCTHNSISSLHGGCIFCVLHFSCSILFLAMTLGLRYLVPSAFFSKERCSKTSERIFHLVMWCAKKQKSGKKEWLSQSGANGKALSPSAQ